MVVLMKRWLLAFMIAANQFANAATGGNPQESISSRLGNARAHGSRGARFGCWLFEQVDFHPPERADHCDQAIEKHIERLRTNLEDSLQKEK